MSEALLAIVWSMVRFKVKGFNNLQSKNQMYCTLSWIHL